MRRGCNVMPPFQNVEFLKDFCQKKFGNVAFLHTKPNFFYIFAPKNFADFNPN